MLETTLPNVADPAELIEVTTKLPVDIKLEVKLPIAAVAEGALATVNKRFAVDKFVPAIKLLTLKFVDETFPVVIEELAKAPSTSNK